MIEARWLGVARRELDSCPSTNDEATVWARAGAPHGAVVTARQQTAGRGRADHLWHSPAEDNIYMSCVLRPDVTPSDVPPITLAAGIGVCDALTLWGARSSLKWPNDVLVMRRKVAGILTEVTTCGSRLDHVVVGVGVNVNALSFPAALGDTAISLRLALGGRRVDRQALFDALLYRLEMWLDRFVFGGVEAVVSPWMERTQPARQRVNAGGVRGVVVGLDVDGALLVADECGRRHRVVAGDVALL